MRYDGCLLFVTVRTRRHILLSHLSVFKSPFVFSLRHRIHTSLLTPIHNENENRNNSKIVIRTAFISSDNIFYSSVRTTTDNGSLVRWQVLLSYVRLELDELLGDFIVGTLRQYAEYRPTRFVHVDAFAQRQPASARTLQKHSI